MRQMGRVMKTFIRTSRHGIERPRRLAMRIARYYRLRANIEEILLDD